MCQAQAVAFSSRATEWPESAWFSLIHYEQVFSETEQTGGLMGRHRTRPSKLFSANQQQTLKKTQPPRGPIPLHDLTAIWRHRRCRKCQGWVMVQFQDLDAELELRCVNCGWRPQHHDRITTESEACRLIRQAARNLLQDDMVKKRISNNS